MGRAPNLAQPFSSCLSVGGFFLSEYCLIFRLYLNHLYLCMSVCGYVYMNADVRRPEMSNLPGAGVTDCCEPLDIGPAQEHSCLSSLLSLLSSPEYWFLHDV